jgi:HD-GYP domain-containing protein (c-di-GMP phosphodiesterase class II)
VDTTREIHPTAATLSAVRLMREYSELTGLEFACIDATFGTVVATTDSDWLTILPCEILDQLPNVTDARVFEHSGSLLFYAFRLQDSDETPLVAFGYVLANSSCRPDEVVLAAAEMGWSQSQLDEWLRQRPHSSPKILKSVLKLAARHVRRQERETVLQAKFDDLKNQIGRTFDENSLLHKLTRSLQISRSPSDLARMCLDQMHALIKSAGSVICLEEKSGATQFLVEGELPFDEFGMARLIAQSEDHGWPQPLVKNHIKGTLLGADFPGLSNFVMVPIAEGAHRSGWILSCNLEQGREFGTVEASLLDSIATNLGNHIRNINLYEQNNELMLSFVRSLVSTLDAKDPYTRGHSERVALIARRLGEELGLPDDDLYDIYLSGLLHDIGKIGINNSILQKSGKLTNDEFKEIQKHPMIGFEILRSPKNLRKILPGVRNHHENFNGKGYPDRLRGEQIPLMARIVAVADGFDAMGSRRPYRDGMPREKIEEIFRRGAGHQWDPRVVDAYFAVRDDVLEICEDFMPSNFCLLDNNSLSEMRA